MHFYLLLVCLFFTSCHSCTQPYDSYNARQQKEKKIILDQHDKIIITCKELSGLIEKNIQLQEQRDQSDENSGHCDALNQEQTEMLDQQIESAPYPVRGLDEKMERCEVCCLGAIAYYMSKIFCPRSTGPSRKKQ